MARSNSDNLDDGTSGAGEGSSYTYTDDAAGYDNSFSKRRSGGGSSGSANNSNSIPILKRLFVGCEDDAPGSVHRAWAVTVMFMVIFFTVSIMEGESAVLVATILGDSITPYPTRPKNRRGATHHSGCCVHDDLTLDSTVSLFFSTKIK